MTKRHEIQLQKCLLYERDSTKSREKGMRCQNNNEPNADKHS